MTDRRCESCRKRITEWEVVCSSCYDSIMQNYYDEDELHEMDKDDAAVWRTLPRVSDVKPTEHAWMFEPVYGERSDGLDIAPDDSCPDCGHEPFTCGGSLCNCKRSIVSWKKRRPSHLTWGQDITESNLDHHEVVDYHARPDKCACGGRGWSLSSWEQWRKCAVHFEGQPRPSELHRTRSRSSARPARRSGLGALEAT
jgi:hypothetical protein